MPSFSGLNYINIGPHGTFTPSGHLATMPADIDALFAHLAQQDINRLAIHFHGGLINEGAGLDIARKMAPLFDQADCHPLTFVWETGLTETISRNLHRLDETRLFRRLRDYVIRHVAKRLGGGIGNKGPGEALSLDEIEGELARADAFDRFDSGARGAAGGLDEQELPRVRDEIEVEIQLELEADTELVELLETGRAETEHLKPELRHATTPGPAKGLIETATLAKAVASVSFNVLRRYIKGTDHGFYPTVVEEILRELYLADFGAWVWGGMKDVATEMWLPNATPPTEDDHAGRYFLEKLAAHQQARPDFTVDLVGHSAGSIAICELFKAAESAGLALSVRNVLFLAPACRSDLFLAEIVRRPERFERFRMFTMNEDLEEQDRLVPGLYTRSLLYFISGALEEEADVPLAGLERHFSGRKPYTGADLLEIRQWLTAPGEQRLVLSKTENAAPGLGSEAAKHGDFDDDPLTRASLAAILAT